MNRQQSGFTLIELIMVIVVLGALAITALPRYVNLQGEADQGAVNGVAGALASGSAINFAACKAGNTTCITFNSTAPNDCTAMGATMQGGLPAGFAITSQSVTGADDTAGYATCTVTGPAPNSKTATFAALTT